MLPYSRKLKQNSRELRSNMTDAEEKLWYRLRRKQINGWQFYRQKTIGSYIVDFYCPAAMLVVELDGSQHFEPQHQAADQKRDAHLVSLGLRVLRFDNRQVLLEMDVVLGVIAQIPHVTLEIPPSPPFSKGGENRRAYEVPLFEQESTVLVTSSKKDTDVPVPPFEKGGLGGICVDPSMNGETKA